MTAAICLINPKFINNLAQVVRAAACLGADTVWWTGDRLQLEIDGLQRLPRELRYRDYDVTVERVADHATVFGVAQLAGLTPVAVEVLDGAVPLPVYVHPRDAMYVFGPEDGSLASAHLSQCHDHVTIPTEHCLNLAAAVHVVLYDRLAKEATQ